MATDRRERVLRLYHDALERDEAARSAFVADACAGDAELRREVNALLTREPPSDFLRPAPAGTSVPSGFTGGDTSLIGRRLGPYRVEAKLGAGGMGEVFRAHDTTLGRDVAIKVLPPLFSRDPERLARFEREAHVLASLNHPHIGAIHGLEQVDGVPALVLELVEGETLSARLVRTAEAGRRALAVHEAIDIARQLAEALEAAHEKGVVHRDLKPANIKFAANGAAKILDFGLSKLVSDAEWLATPSVAPTHERTPTRTGVVMGTVAYMSPEQAKGARVDKRTDIWAFGCVLYEMLTGRAAFAKATAAETIGAVLHHEADWNALAGDTPAAVRVVLERCLQKDPKDRLRDMGDVQLALTGAFLPSAAATVAPSSLTAASATRVSSWRLAAIVAFVLLTGLVTSLALWRGNSATRSEITRLSIGARGAAALYIDGNNRELTITPDGSRVVYVGDDSRRIFVRALNELEPVAIATGAILADPFVSPDGQWVGYGEGLRALKKVPIAGGPPITITEVSGGLIRGAVWLADNTIVYGTAGVASGLLRISAGGGSPQVLTTPDAARNEFDHFWPSVLSDGRGIVYTVLARIGGLSAARIAILDLETNKSTDLLTGGSNPFPLGSGHLAYVAGGTLWAVGFDAARRAIVGGAVPIVRQLDTSRTGAGNFAVSANGTLVYAHNSGFDPFARTLSWVDRTGKLEPLDAPQQPYMQPRFSHDGTRIVHSTGTGPDNNLWVLDLSRKVHTRLRTEASRDQQPSWSRDDRWIYYASDRAGSFQIWRQAADGTGEPELLVKRGTTPLSTPDGTQLIYVDIVTAQNADIMQMALDGSLHVSPLVQTPFDDSAGEISPDGRWLAYTSNASGRQELYVRPYPDASGRWQVSTAGGIMPRWRRDSRELFFMAPEGALMGIQVRSTGSTWSATPAVKVLAPGYWSRMQIGPNYDVSPDGTRFLVVTAPREQADPPDLVVVQHWHEELKARVPTKGIAF